MVSNMFWVNVCIVGRKETGELQCLAIDYDGETINCRAVKTQQASTQAGRRSDLLLQISVWKWKKVLCCLTEEGINFFSLPKLQLKAQAQRTGGATYFALNEKSNSLAVLVKKRLMIFRYESIGVTLECEIALGHQGLSCVICDNNIVAVLSNR